MIKNWINFKTLFLINIIMATISLVAIVIAIISLIVFPPPERTNIKYMTPQMIAEGQGIAITIYTVVAWIILILFIPNLITSTVSTYYIFHKYHYQYNWQWNIIIIIYSFFNILLPFFFTWIIIFFYYKIKKFIGDKRYYNFSKFKGAKKFWKTSVLAIDLTIVAIPCAFVIYNVSYWSWLNNKIPLRQEALKQAYTLSANKPNTMVLYFDRGVGVLFNLLLAVDYAIFKDDNMAFAQLYPEFTSYVNSLSLSLKTNGSVPSINGS